MKRLIVTYYAVWYLAHKNSKHAKDFSHYWYHAFLQVAASVSAILVSIFVLIDGIFGVRPIFFSGKFTFVFVFLIIPACLLYYLIFYKYGVDKNASDQDFDYLKINRKKKIRAWLFFLFNLVFVMLLMYLFYS